MDVDERRQSELQKHFTQPWLETALSVARGAMWHWQVEPFEVSYTDSYYRLFGVDPFEGRKQSRFWYNNIHPDDRNRATRIAHNMLEGNEERYEQEYRMRRADGRWMWVLDRACAIKRDETGRARQMVGFVIDFTEQRAQREALRASEELFRHATIAAQGMVFEVDFANATMNRFGTEHLLGYRNDELGTTREEWMAKIHPEDVPRFMALRPAHTTEGHSEVVEYRMRHKAGHWLWLRGSGITLTDGNGRPTRRVGFLRHIAEPEFRDPGSKP
jgi:two-component system CheB/CheR fusion protein